MVPQDLNTLFLFIGHLCLYWNAHYAKTTGLKFTITQENKAKILVRISKGKTLVQLSDEGKL